MQNGTQPISQEMQRLTGSTVHLWSTKRSLRGRQPVGKAPVGHGLEVPQATIDTSEQAAHSTE